MSNTGPPTYGSPLLTGLRPGPVRSRHSSGHSLCIFLNNVVTLGALTVTVKAGLCKTCGCSKNTDCFEASKPHGAEKGQRLPLLFESQARALMEEKTHAFCAVYARTCKNMCRNTHVLTPAAVSSKPPQILCSLRKDCLFGEVATIIACERFLTL